MATGSDIITDSLAYIGYLAAETAIEPADMQLGLRIFNDEFAGKEISGSQLGFIPLATESDDVDVPRGLVGPLKCMLASHLAIPFRKSISPELAAAINEANKIFRRYTVNIGDVTLPATMPTGSGNERHYSYTERFFPEKDKKNF